MKRPLLLATALLLGACAEAAPVVAPRAEPPSPFIVGLDDVAQVRMGMAGRNGKAGIRVFLKTTRDVEASEGFRIVVRDREGAEVESAPIESHYQEVELEKAFAPGDYEVEITGPGHTILEREVRVADVKNAEGATVPLAFLHRGTRIWLDEGVLTVARFWAAEWDKEPVTIEWYRDGALVETVHSTRISRFRNSDYLWPNEDTTPWRYGGETYPFPEALARSPGHWSARIYASGDPIAVAFDVGAHGLIDAEARWIGGTEKRVSRTLAITSLPARPDIETLLARKREPFVAVDRGEVRTFAPEIAPTPDFVRALTRDPKLAKMIISFEMENKETILGGGHVEIARTDPTPVSPEQAYRDQRRADDEAVDDNTRKNRERKTEIPRLRAQILAIVQKEGGPFTAAEIPK